MFGKKLNTFSVLILISLLALSCKKNKNEVLPTDTLTGTWQEITTGYNRVLIFQPGNKITILIKSSQYADWHV